MTHTALAVFLLLICAALGARAGAGVTRPWVAAIIAMVVVAAQSVLLLSR